MAFSDPIFSHRSGKVQEMRRATFEAWIENRAYSTWPCHRDWEIRKRELLWQSSVMVIQFSATYIRRALYSP